VGQPGSFGVVLKVNPGRGLAFVALQSGKVGTMELAEVARGMERADSYRVES
jgi:hypothetical protein